MRNPSLRPSLPSLRLACRGVALAASATALLSAAPGWAQAGTGAPPPAADPPSAPAVAAETPAAAPAPSPAPAPATPQDEAPTDAMPLDVVMVLDPTREIRVATGAVGRDQTLVSIPYRYRRTAVLTKDLIGGSFWLGRPTVVMKAGAKGYWAGRFRVWSSGGGYGYYVPPSRPTNEFVEVWCFYGVDARDRPANLCIREGDSETLSFTPVGAGSGYFLPGITASAFAAVFDFTFEERPVEIVADQRLEYRFREWDRDDVDVLIAVNGELLNNRPRKRSADGSVTYATPAGELRLTQVGSDRTQASVSLLRGAVAAPREPALSSIMPQNRAAIGRQLASMAERQRQMAAAEDRRTARPIRIETAAELPATAQTFRRNAVITRQSIRTLGAWRQLASPQGRPNRFGPAGAILFAPLDRGERALLCLNPEIPGLQPSALATTQHHCIEDADKDGLYEILWKDIIFSGESGTAVAELMTRTPLRAPSDPPVAVERIDTATLPAQQIELVNLGVTDEEPTADGGLRPEQLSLGWRYVGTSQMPGTPRYFRIVRIPVDLDRAGRLVDRQTGATIEVRDVQIDGTASIRVSGGYPVSERPLRDPKADAERLRAIAERFEAGAEALQQGKDVNVRRLLDEQ